MIVVGASTITAIPEHELNGLHHLIPLATTDTVRDIGWLGSPYLDADGQMVGIVQTLVVEHGGAVIVVDTCVGDGKDLPANPEWAHLTTGFLERFLEHGFDPDDVDFVLCTHLHLDHVGWNTRRDGERWVPTFPNARYLFARTEYEYWQHEAETAASATSPTTERERLAQQWASTQANVQRESVDPIVAAGLAEIVELPHEILPGLRLVPTPGHTPGHACIELTSAGHTCVITGDSFHHPCQIARPEWSTRVDSDRDQSTATRQRILESIADTGGVLIGTHFVPPSHGTVVSAPDGHQFVPGTP